MTNGVYATRALKVRVVGLLVVLMLVFGCAEDENAAVAQVPEFTGQRLSEGRNVWIRTCRNCHLMGVAGAPAISDPVAWRERREKGVDMLYRSALQGKKKDNRWSMPPRGGNDLLSDEQVRKAVDFMLAAVDELSDQ